MSERADSSQDWSRSPVIVAVLLALAELGVGQLEWVHVGASSRNSYELFRSAQRLGLGELTPFRVVWYLLPVVALTFALALAGRRTRIAGVLLGGQSVVVAVAGLAVQLVGADAGAGSKLAIPLGAAGLVAGAVLVLDRRWW